MYVCKAVRKRDAHKINDSICRDIHIIHITSALDMIGVCFQLTYRGLGFSHSWMQKQIKSDPRRLRRKSVHDPWSSSTTSAKFHVKHDTTISSLSSSSSWACACKSISISCVTEKVTSIVVFWMPSSSCLLPYHSSRMLARALRARCVVRCGAPGIRSC